MVKKQEQKTPKASVNNIHVHHRERMLEKFRTTSPDLFPEHEILEMVLFYSRPRINTNDIAHRLIDKFGSLHGVLDADLHEITRVEGVGIRSAIQLKLIHECAIRYATGKKKRGNRIPSSEIAGQFFIDKLGMQKRECVMVMLLDNNDAVIDSKILFEGIVNYTPMNFRKIIEFICSCNAASIYIAHNHPNGELIPSDADIDNTVDLKNLCYSLDIGFKDHIIVAGDAYLSVLDYLVESRKKRETIRKFPN